MKEKISTPRKFIKITMDRKFSEFNAHAKSDFISDLEDITGVPKSEFLNVKFRRGCVIFEAEIDAAAIDKLIKLISTNKKIYKSDAPPTIIAFTEFITKHRISKATTERVHRFNIIRRSSEPNLVLIHGWNGSNKSFGRMKELLDTDPNVNPIIYPYPTSVWSKSPSVSFISKNLDNFIRNHIQREDFGIVAHSMGGIVTRSLIIEQEWSEASLEDRIKSIILIASPHNGAAFAKLGSKIPTLQKAQLGDLSTDSSFIYELNRRWAKWHPNAAKKNIHIRSIFGTEDSIVSPNNAKGLDPNAIPVFRNHRNIVDPSSPDDEVTTTIIRLLRESGLIPSLTRDGTLRVAADKWGDSSSSRKQRNEGLQRTRTLGLVGGAKDHEP